MRISKKVRESFANAQTIGELRKVYLKNMLKYNAPFYTEQLNALYIQYFDEVKEVRRTLKGKLYKKPTEETASFFLNMVNTLKGVEGLEFKFEGEWVWVAGQTKKNKETIKKAGCQFSGKRQEWYIA